MLTTSPLKVSRSVRAAQVFSLSESPTSTFIFPAYFISIISRGNCLTSCQSWAELSLVLRLSLSLSFSHSLSLTHTHLLLLPISPSPSLSLFLSLSLPLPIYLHPSPSLSHPPSLSLFLSLPVSFSLPPSLSLPLPPSLPLSLPPSLSLSLSVYAFSRWNKPPRFVRLRLTHCCIVSVKSSLRGFTSQFPGGLCDQIARELQSGGF